MQILNVDDEVHVLFTLYLPQLHQLFSPRFCDGGNNHPLSSEHGMSPIQLWVYGLSQASSIELMRVLVS